MIASIVVRGAAAPAVAPAADPIALPRSESIDSFSTCETVASERTPMLDAFSPPGSSTISILESQQSTAARAHWRTLATVANVCLVGVFSGFCFAGASLLLSGRHSLPGVSDDLAPVVGAGLILLGLYVPAKAPCLRPHRLSQD